MFFAFKKVHFFLKMLTAATYVPNFRQGLILPSLSIPPQKEHLKKPDSILVHSLAYFTDRNAEREN